MRLTPKRKETKEERAIRKDGQAQLRQIPKLTDEHHRMSAKPKCKDGGNHRFLELGDGHCCCKCGGWLNL